MDSRVGYRASAVVIVLLLAGFVGARTAPSARAEGCVPVPAGIVSWWPGDGFASDIADGNPGSLENGATFAAGMVGQAFRFDGVDDRVAVPNSVTGNLDLTSTAVSVDAWVNPSTLNQPRNPTGAMTIVDKWFSHDRSDGYLLYINEGKPTFGVATASGIALPAGPHPVAISAFTHLAGVYDGASVKVYVNGVLVASQALSGNILHDDFNVAIGNDNGGSRNYGMNGLIDEVEIFNRALSASEVQSIAQAGAAGKCKPTCVTPATSIVAWLPGDGSPGDIRDSNPGTLRNGATFTTGFTGQAFSFDGLNDYVDLPSKPVSAVIGTQFTIEFWANPGPTADRPSFGFLGSGTANTNNPIASYDSFLTFGGGGGGYELMNRLPDAAPNAWTHYAIVDDGTNYRVYVNGVLVQSQSIFVNPASGGSRQLAFGQSGFGSPYESFYRGALDELTIYNAGLTASDIGSIVRAGPAGKCKVVNTAPVISSFTATTVPEGTATVFAVAASDLQGDPLTYQWDFENDGAFDLAGPSHTASHIWGDDHAGTARVRVSDGTLSTDALITVRVGNAVPQVAVTVGPATEGQPLEVAYHLTDPGSDDLSVGLNWGDGEQDSRAYLVGGSADPAESTDINPRDVSDQMSRVFGDDATLQGTLTVTDDDGGTVTADMTLVVVNGEPQVSLVLLQEGDEGAPLGYAASATDPGSDPLTFTWSFGDGETVARTYPNDAGTFPFIADDSGTHVWGDDGIYAVALMVEDDDGGSMFVAFEVSIRNVAPTVGILSTVSVFPATPGDPDVLGDFEFNGDVRDSSGHGRDATFLGGQYVPTARGQGLRVFPAPGPDGVNAPMGIDWSAYASLLAYPYTIEVVLTPQATDCWHKLFGFDDANDDGWYYCSDAFQAYPNPEVGIGLMSPGDEHYLAFVATAPDQIDVYFQGVFVGSTPASFEAPPAQAIFFRDDQSTGRYEQLHGVVDALRISSRARTPGEIVTVQEGLDELATVEGSPISLAATFFDPGFDIPAIGTMESFTAEVAWGDGLVEPLAISVGPGGPGVPTTGSLAGSHVYADDGVYAAAVTVCDDDGGCGSDTLFIRVTNVAPSVSLTAPAAGSVFAVGESVLFSAEFTDPGFLDAHAASWTFDGLTFAGTVTESGGSGSVADTFAFTAPGVYYVTLTVTDDDGGVGTASSVDGVTAFVVIYDASEGFVTGGGWIPSPPGAWGLDPALTGKASFGFVSKYQKGAKIPTGETEFQFKVADLNFHSTSYDWLVIGGPKAQYKGTGTINSAGTYGFMLTAIDGQLPGGGGQDKLRMKIWDILTGQLVYDNQMGEDDNSDPTTVLGGGSIVIHMG